MIDAVLVGLGGALGAVLRFAVSERIEGGSFPLAILVVNVLGSFALGAITFAGVETDWALFLGVGACGAFTTFSSFSVGTVQLWETVSARRAGVFAILNLVGAIGSIGLAWLLVGP